MKGTFSGAFLLASVGFAADYPRSLDLPDEPSVRAALERISVRSGISLPRTSWPLLAREARQFLDQVAAKDSSALTKADSVALFDLIVGPKELVRWTGMGPSILALHARASGQWTGSDSASGKNERMGWLGGRMYGVVGGDLWYFSDARIFTRWSDDYVYWDRYALADDEPSAVPFNDPSVNNRYKSNTGARYTAWAQWTRDWITVKYGRDHLQFGPGRWTGLTTNYTTPPYQMLDTRLTPFSWLTVQATVLEARPGEELGGIFFAGDARKWMHVHRYEIRPLDGLSLAFQNQVLYRDSGGVNPAYLLPLVPIFFSQDLSGNRDNSAMQFDFSYASKWGVKTWGALLIDDLNGVTDIAGDAWLNRWALLVGGQVLSPWKSFDADLAVEYSQVRPWTFTGGREEAYSFAHYGVSMGTELGPDSRTFHSRLAWRPLRRLEIGTEYALLQKGQGRQAQIGVVHNGYKDPDTATLFANGRNSIQKMGGDVSFDWNAMVKAQAFLRVVHQDLTGSGESSWAEGGAQWVLDW